MHKVEKFLGRKTASRKERNICLFMDGKEYSKHKFVDVSSFYSKLLTLLRYWLHNIVHWIMVLSAVVETLKWKYASIQRPIKELQLGLIFEKTVKSTTLAWALAYKNKERIGQQIEWFKRFARSNERRRGANVSDITIEVIYDCFLGVLRVSKRYFSMPKCSTVPFIQSTFSAWITFAFSTTTN